MDQTAPAIVAAEDGTQKRFAFYGHEAQPWVPVQEPIDGLRFIRVAEPDARRSLPEAPR
jgi:hypothetical protein